MTTKQPYDELAEQAVLGAMLTEREAIRRVVDTLREADFYGMQHREIYRAICGLYRANKPALIVTVLDALGDRAAAVGGLSYLLELQEVMGTAAAVEHYAEIVRKHSRWRRLMKLGRSVWERAQAEDDAEAISSEAAEELYQIGAGKAASFQHFGREVASEVVDRIEAQRASGRGTVGVGTGIPKLDDLISGWCPSTYYILAARPSVGKSALAWQTAVEAARQGYRTVVFCLEMSSVMMGLRYLARQVPKDLTALIEGKVDSAEWNTVVRVLGESYQWPLFLCQRSDLTISQMRSEVRKLTSTEGKIDLVVVDYIGLMNVEHRASRNEEVSEISRGIKAMTQELGCAALAISQLNRQNEVDRRQPELRDLRDSGTLEQDADVVTFLHFPWWEANWPESQRWMVVAKQRNGACRRFLLHWNGTYQTFGEMSGRDE